MKIVFDNIIFSLQKSGGISVVWYNLLKRIMQENNKHYYIEYKGAEKNLFRSKLKIPSCDIITKSASFLNIKRFFEPEINLNEKFIFHSSYFRISNNPNAINVTTVHDFIYKFYTQGFNKFLHCRQMENAIRKSASVICISENTKKDLLRLMPDVNPNKIVVVYNGIDSTFKEANDCATKNYILYVGGRDEYKGFNQILPAIAASKKDIYIVGKPLSNSEKSRLHKLGCKYKEFNYIDNNYLCKLYNEAFCLLYPSKYEGFGLPVLEAEKSGCPVIAFDASSIPEISAEKELLIHSYETKEILSKFSLLENERFRTNAINKGFKKSMLFSWDKMAGSYIDIYNKLYNK